MSAERVVWKYELSAPSISLAVPAGAELLSVGMQGDAPVVWFLVDPTAELEGRRLVGVSTGLDFNVDRLSFVGRIDSDAGLVFHIFEERAPK
ncbi:hypothetical protein HQ535_15640 [bacterium]|nr:hypothetical protein [bacterium]